MKSAGPIIRPLLAGAGLVLAVAGWAADEKDISAAQQYRVAYDSMKMADWARDQGMKDDALDLYAEAQNVFQQITSNYPNWYARTVIFRRDYCAGERARLQSSSAPAGLVADAGGRLQLAAEREHARDYRGALNLYQAILAEQPQSDPAIKGTARCYLRLGPIGEAQALLQKAMARPAPDAEIRLLMALVYCYNKQYQKAVPLLNGILELEPANEYAHVTLGVALMGLGETDTAIEEMKKALSLNLKISEAYYNQAQIILAQKKPGSVPMARLYYQNSLKYGGEPDPALVKVLLEPSL